MGCLSKSSSTRWKAQSSTWFWKRKGRGGFPILQRGGLDGRFHDGVSHRVWLCSGLCASACDHAFVAEQARGAEGEGEVEMKFMRSILHVIAHALMLILGVIAV